MPFTAPIDYVQMPPSIQQHAIRHVSTGSTINKNLLNGDKFILARENNLNDPLFEHLKNQIIREVLELISKNLNVFEEIKNEEVRVNVFKEITVNLVLYKCRAITFEKTNDQSVLLKAKLGDLDFFMEFFEDIELELGYEAVLNVYQDKKNILLDSGSVSSLFQKLVNLYHSENVLST